MSAFTIIARQFTADEFSTYIDGVTLTDWTPTLIVLHNTYNPTLKACPDGFNDDRIENLHQYYQFQVDNGPGKPKGWSGGPHLFVDQNGVWVFNPLDRHGVHSPSWNKVAWGVEMLGDYSTESFDDGPGLDVQKNAVAALAAMFRKLGIDTVDNDNFKLHREDTLTSHKGCPGSNVDKQSVMTAVQAQLSVSTTPPAETPVKIVVYRKGAGEDPSAVVAGALVGGVCMADVQDLADATGLDTDGAGKVSVREFVGDAYSIRWDGANSKVYLIEN